MSTIRFVLFNHDDFLCKLIKFWTRGNTCHTAFIYNYNSSNILKSTLIEPYGARLTWKVNFLYIHKNSYFEIWSKDVPTDKYIDAINFFTHLVNKKWKYDWKGILGFVIKTTDSKNSYFCSEGCAYSLVKSQIWPQLTTEIIHPTFFRELLKVSDFTLEHKGIVHG